MAYEYSTSRSSLDHRVTGATGASARRCGTGGERLELPYAGQLPSIFFVGPPRTATTWLHSVFKDRMNLPRLKETYFFDKLYAKGFHWYLSHFDAASAHRTKAEMAPSYFYSGDARHRIAAAAGAVKIVVTLRDPVARLYSLYKMRYSNAVFSWSFEEACERDSELRATGRYAPDLIAWQQCFGSDQVLLLLYEDMQSDPQAWVDRICNFLEMERFRLRDEQLAPVHSSEPSLIPRHPRWTRLAVGVGDLVHARQWEGAITLIRRLRLRRFFLENGQSFPKLDPKVVQRLRHNLITDIEETELILGRDLSMWKS
ncbi:MAG TPA: sulfotransferase [Candidatus Binataceae bacterium]|jgi:hypothetical protein